MTEQQTNQTSTDVAPAKLEAALRDIGLAPIKAWVPGPAAKTSATAKRAKKARDKAAESGLKQLSITLPIEAHPLAREFSSRTKAGESVADVLDDLRLQVGEASVEASSAAPATITPAPTVALVGLSAWRRWLISLALPAESRTLLGLRRGGA